MTFCDSCETCKWCLKHGCIPPTPPDDLHLPEIDEMLIPPKGEEIDAQ